MFSFAMFVTAFVKKSPYMANSIGCDKYNNWFHYECVGLTGNVFKREKIVHGFIKAVAKKVKAGVKVKKK